MNLISTFLDTAERQPDTIAVVDRSGVRITYGALARRSAALASLWQKRGIRKSQRVLVALPIGIDLYAAIAALWRLGAVVVFPEPALGLSGLRNAVRLAKPDATVTSGWYTLLPYAVPDLWRVSPKLRIPSSLSDRGELADTLEPVDDHHPALISFTSGSTGLPKGIVRSHGFLNAQNHCVRQILSPDGSHTVDLVTFPVFVIANLGVGTTSVLPNWKVARHAGASSAAISDLVKRERITRALVPPSICDVLVNGKTDIGLETIFTGGGPIFPDLMKALQTVCPATKVMAVYGSTEAEPIAHTLLEEISDKDYEAMQSGQGLLAGQPVPETQVKIINDEIVVTGDHVNKGYLDGEGDAENKLTIDGKIWHRTGDAGSFDDKGRLWLRGRWSAIADGRYPFEFEVAARLWPGVRNVALVPDSSPPCLVIEGEEQYSSEWTALAKQLGPVELRTVPKIPLDKRHGSKVDYGALRRLVAND